MTIFPSARYRRFSSLTSTHSFGDFHSKHGVAVGDSSSISEAAPSAPPERNGKYASLATYADIRLLLAASMNTRQHIENPRQALRQARWALSADARNVMLISGCRMMPAIDARWAASTIPRYAFMSEAGRNECMIIAG